MATIPEDWLVIASLAGFAIVVIALSISYRKQDKSRGRRDQARREAEAHALGSGGWFIYRDGRVYCARDDAEFLEQCRNGLVHPTDDVFVASEQRWRRAVDVPLADLAFPARYFGRSQTPSSAGCALVLLLFWWLSCVEEVRKLVERATGAAAADVIAGGLLLVSLLAVWHYVRTSRLPMLVDRDGG
jgi:hypothetical protein